MGNLNNIHKNIDKLLSDLEQKINLYRDANFILASSNISSKARYYRVSDFFSKVAFYFKEKCNDRVSRNNKAIEANNRLIEQANSMKNNLKRVEE